MFKLEASVRICMAWWASFSISFFWYAFWEIEMKAFWHRPPSADNASRGPSLSRRRPSSRRTNHFFGMCAANFRALQPNFARCFFVVFLFGEVKAIKAYGWRKIRLPSPGHRHATYRWLGHCAAFAVEGEKSWFTGFGHDLCPLKNGKDEDSFLERNYINVVLTASFCFRASQMNSRLE